MATYDHELVLISRYQPRDEAGRPQVDQWLNPLYVEERRTVLCKLKAVTRAEYYSAAAAGMRPSLVFVVHAYEYNGETLVEFEGKRYNVVRTYKTDFEEIELVVERVVGRDN